MPFLKPPEIILTNAYRTENKDNIESKVVQQGKETARRTQRIHIRDDSIYLTNDGDIEVPLTEVLQAAINNLRKTGDAYNAAAEAVLEALVNDNQYP